MDKNKAIELFDKLEETLEIFCKANKLDFKLSAKSFSESGISTKLELAIVAEGEDMQLVEFKKYCGAFGCSVSDYLKTFTVQGETYQLTGFAPRARKYPIIARKVSSGQSYKMPLAVLSGQY